MIRLAEAAGVPVYIVHLSARDALDAVRDARDRGAQAFAETCPQYLFLSLDDMGNGFEGAKFVCSPPLRPTDPHWEELWTGLGKDDLQVVSTDHCPFDFHGQKELGRGDFRKIPNGLPGVEDRVDLLHDGGVVGGRISRERWVEIISTAPARLFGMYPRKGAVAVGADADLVVYDPSRTRTISAKTHHMDVDYSCYEGRHVQGASDVVLSRGLGRRPRRRSSPAARATAGSSSGRPPISPAWPDPRWPRRAGRRTLRPPQPDRPRVARLPSRRSSACRPRPGATSRALTSTPRPASATPVSAAPSCPDLGELARHGPTGPTLETQ